MTASLLGAAALALLAIWLLGGLALRLGGFVVALAGALGLALGGGPGGILVSGIGALLWLAGHWHFAARHHTFKSALAHHVFCRWAPARLDPTRGWALAVRPERHDHDSGDERGRVS